MAYYNLVNHDLKLIVSFNPKCACTTLKKWFRHSLPDAANQNQNVTRFMLPAKEIECHSDYAKILFIRDPFRRLVSFYCHWVVRDTRQWCFADKNQEFRLEGKTFSEFLNIIAKLENEGLTPQHHLQSQTRESMNIIYDAVLPIENLNIQLEKLSSIYAIKFDVSILNANNYDNSQRYRAYDCRPDTLLKNGIPSFKYFYNADLKKIVKRVYGEDLRYYQAYHYKHLLFKAPIPFITQLKSQLMLSRAWKISGARKQ